ncbi:hypothetical protein M011DRAFT_57044 [Sporormia fimetaria CBS 119925]|uniref:Uncharacterized protein n=1 Tax=Sporormia fimetaria CBS 119925 TaxID=1340428 RepID=A0A6A6VCA6_9PLEO|nr:hypothetical protein M011DRAFT_57044 [Sporormia fimetaria CBS 119925]
MQFPASVLFCEKELESFVRWQREEKALPESQWGVLPDAYQYADYTAWHQKLRSVYRAHPKEPESGHETHMEGFEMTEVKDSDEPGDAGWAQAEICGHALHPAHPAFLREGDTDDSETDELPYGVVRCPTCIITAHMEFLAALETRWAEAGGPWRTIDRQTDPDASRYVACTQAYHWAKAHLMNLVADYERWAEDEAKWEKQNPLVDVEVPKAYGAARAMEKFRQDQHLELNTCSSEQEAQIGRRNTSKEGKQITFTPDTVDSLGRSNALYHRSSDSYDLDCPHASPHWEGWEDTSFSHSLLYNIAQCRILLVIRDSEAHPEVTYIELNEGEGRGENKHVCRLQEIVMDWLMASEPDARGRWGDYYARTSDYFLVWREDLCYGDDFTSFTTVASLVGTEVEEYARLIGHIDEEDLGEQDVAEEDSYPEVLTEACLSVEDWTEDFMLEEGSHMEEHSDEDLSREQSPACPLPSSWIAIQVITKFLEREKVGAARTIPPNPAILRP